MAVSTFIIFAGLLGMVFGELNIAKITPCEGVSEDKCTVSEVRIDPCTAGATFCKFHKGINASMEVDFTPNFSTNNLKTGVTYQGTPFAGLTTEDCCGFTKCPTEPGQQQTLAITLHVGKKLPKGSFNFNWKIWNGDNPTEDVCCFQTTVRLVK